MPVHITGEGPEAMEWVPKWQARDMELSLLKRISEAREAIEKLLSEDVKDILLKTLRP